MKTPCGTRRREQSNVSAETYACGLNMSGGEKGCAYVSFLFTYGVIPTPTSCQLHRGGVIYKDETHIHHPPLFYHPRITHPHLLPQHKCCVRTVDCTHRNPSYRQHTYSSQRRYRRTSKTRNRQFLEWYQTRQKLSSPRLHHRNPWPPHCFLGWSYRNPHLL